MSFIKDYFYRLSSGYYNIGFVTSKLDSIVAHGELNVHWLKHRCSSSWFADPFIINADDSYIYVLVEEWDSRKRKGHISRLLVDRGSFELVNKDIALELDTHLSFPAYYVKDEKIFIYPENCASGALYCYEYDPIDNKCKSKSLLIDLPLTDAIIFENDHRTFLFGTKHNESAGNGNRLFVFELKNGAFVQTDLIVFSDNIARMAGNMFRCAGKLYRPAQESNHSYGHSVSIQEAWFNDSHWHFKEIKRIKSPNKKLSYGFHTFNVYGDLVAVDAFQWYHPTIRKLFVDDWGNANKLVRIASHTLRKG